MLRSMTQDELPSDLDIRAPMPALSNRLNHRTGVLGQAVQSLDSGHSHVLEGCSAVESQLHSFSRALQAQQVVIEAKSST